MSNIYPSKIAFCFLSSTIEQTIPQQIEILKLESQFKIEKWFRYEKYKKNYVSFSQMINDAINETESEFMVFCNPKTIFNEKDILKIIDKLSNGFCFASIVNFGLFGITKELIRRIGMLDETLLFGEYEDQDFALRLNLLGKAVWWEYDYDKYSFNFSNHINNRSISSSVFYTKYLNTPNSNIYLLGKNYLEHKKINKQHSNFNPEIYNSWLSKEHSFSNCVFGDLSINSTIILDERDEFEKLVDFEINLIREDKYYKFEFLTNEDILLVVTITKSFDDGRDLIMTNRLTPNTWYSNYIEHDSVEVRLFIQGTQLYTNTLKNNIYFNQKFSLPLKIRI
jgi:hypothetical protein